MPPRKRTRNRPSLSSVPAPLPSDTAPSTSASAAARPKSDYSDHHHHPLNHLHHLHPAVPPPASSAAAVAAAAAPSPSHPPSSSSSPTPPFVGTAADSRTVMAAAAAHVAGAPSVAAVALNLYDQLIDWAVLHVSVQFKHQSFAAAEERKKASNLPSSKISIVDDSYGSRLRFSEKNVFVKCSNCSENQSANRYAQHFEKCLGRGGRASSRNANLRLRASANGDPAASSPDASRNSNSSPDLNGGPPSTPAPTGGRRRRGATAAAKTPPSQLLDAELSGDYSGSGSGTGGGNGNHTPAAHKRRKIGASGGIMAGMNSRGLPPSGRTRSSPK